MNLKFWPPFFLSTFVCLLLAFFAGFSLKKFLDIPREQSLLKQSVKLDSLLSLERLNKKLSFLFKEGERIQSEGKINSDSPFFALVFSDLLKEEIKVYMAEDQLPFSLTSQKQEDPLSKEQSGKKPDTKITNKKATGKDGKDQASVEVEEALIKLSRIDSSPEYSEDFQFQTFKALGEKKVFVLFTQFYDQAGKALDGFFKRG